MENNVPDKFPCFLVAKDDAGKIGAAVREVTLDELPPGDVVIRVAYSSLNYKDALAATGHPGVTRKLPHVPGIDASGVVVADASGKLAAGDEVLVTGYGLGEDRWGGWCAYVRMPAENVVPLPKGLSLLESMIYGTAGFTAGQSLSAILERGIEPGQGPVVVTGASGGVGSLAVALLAKAGFEVFAVTGKPEAHAMLARLGAAGILSREDVDDRSGKPLLSSRWAAAVDTVGGNILATILRSAEHRAVICACGLVAGVELPITVYPFILRGVSLVGIDSAKCPWDARMKIWQHLASDWKVANLEHIAKRVNLSQLGHEVQEILAGRVMGRVVVEPTTGT